MTPWFRKGLSPHHTALAMIGAKPGDRVIVVGAANPDLAAEIALATGLNGSTAVVDEDAMARARVDAAARKAGALVEFEEAPPMRLTAAADSIDIVVLMMGFGRRPSAERPGPIGEALRVLRPGGRVVIVEGAKTGGMLRALQEKPPRLDTSEMLALLDVAGFRARRQLADVDGVAFYEARKT